MMQTRVKLLAGLALALLSARPAAAMVPPHIQQRNQLRTLIDLPALASFFPVDRIELVRPDLWRVTAGRCHIDVRMVPRARTGPGLLPPRIELQPGRRICGR
jgi:hypothetical protein